MQPLAAGILSSYSQKWQPSLFSARYALGMEVVLVPVALEKRAHSRIWTPEFFHFLFT